MNSELVQLKISDLGEIVTGNTPPTTERKLYGEKFPLIMPTDMVEGEKYIRETAENLSDDGYKKYKKNILPSNTPCVVTIGSIGKKLCMTKEPSFTNQAVNAVKVYIDKFDPIFVFYLLKYNLPQVKYLSNGTASGRENVSKSSFSKIKVILPKDLSTQRKIASILSSYDALIENNNQRIKLLEEMAEEIYKEWFVRLRFPGYESVIFFDEGGNEVAHGSVGSLPEGWEKVTLDFFAKSIKKPYQDDLHSDLQILDLSRMPRKSLYLPILGDSEDLTTSRIIFEKNDVLFGTIRSYFHKVSCPNKRGITNVSVLVLRARKETYNKFLLMTIFSDYFINWSTAFSNGTKMPTISWNEVKKFKLNKPTLSLLNEFERIVFPFIEEIQILSEKNRILEETRNLLLPRLISGKLSVEHLLDEVESLSSALKPEQSYGKN